MNDCRVIYDFYGSIIYNLNSSIMLSDRFTTGSKMKA